MTGAVTLTGSNPETRLAASGGVRPELPGKVERERADADRERQGGQDAPIGLHDVHGRPTCSRRRPRTANLHSSALPLWATSLARALVLHKASMRNTLRVDGGMAVSDWTMQRLADILDTPVDRPQIKETTALGAAYLAGLHTGFFPEPDRFLNHWRLERRFEPRMGAKERARRLAEWSAAVRRLLS